MNNLKKIFLKSPFVFIWNIALIVGGGILLIYFASIKYIPILDIENVLYLLVASAVVGMFLFVYFLFLSTFPAFLLESLIVDQLGYVDDQNDNHKQQRKDLYLRLLLISPVLASVFFIFIMTILYEKNYLSNSSLQVISFWTSLILVVLISTFSIKKYLHRFEEIQTEKIPPLSIVMISGLIYLMLIIVSVMTLYILDVGADWAELLVFLFILAIMNMINIFIRSYRTKFIISAFLFVLMLIGLERFTFFPAKTTEILKIGHIPNATLVLDSEGCQVMEMQNIKILWNDKNSFCTRKVSMIWSRIGAEYYVQIGTDAISIPSESVKSMKVSKGNKLEPDGMKIKEGGN